MDGQPGSNYHGSQPGDTAVQNEHVVCSSEGLCILSVMHCTMGAPSARADHPGDCPSSLLPDGVSLPASGTGDPAVYISAGAGVHLPECCTRTMEGGLGIRP